MTLLIATSPLMKAALITVGAYRTNLASESGTAAVAHALELTPEDRREEREPFGLFG